MALTPSLGRGLRITGVDVFALRGPRSQRPHWTAHFTVPPGNELLVKLHTNAGISGFGLATSYTSLEPVLKPWRSGFADLVIDQDASRPERLYHKLFQLTTSRKAHAKGWSREAVIRSAAAVDIACWDIIGKAAQMPLWRLFGGFGGNDVGEEVRIPVYATCGYYREGKDLAGPELRDELQMMMDQGHHSFKVKTGGAETLAEDINRLEFIREVLGDDKDLMVDVNRGWDLPTAIEGVRALEGLRVRWLEEPLKWEDDRRLLKLLRQHTTIPLSAGESEITSFGCRALLEEQAINILQFDSTMYGGFTEGRKLAALCELNHVSIAPHHDCFIHASLVASSPAGLILEAFTDPERDPLQAELFDDPPTIKNGMLEVSEKPGLGLDLSERAVQKFGEKVASLRSAAGPDFEAKSEDPPVQKFRKRLEMFHEDSEGEDGAWPLCGHRRNIEDGVKT